MPRHRDDFGIDAADRETFAVGEQAIELRAVDREVFAEIEDRPERLLHRADAFADRERRVGESRFQPVAGAEMIGMRMGFEDPADVESVRARMIDQRLRRGRRGPAGFGVEVEHRIDDGGLSRRRVVNDVAPGATVAVEERRHLCAHDGLRLCGCPRF